MKGKWLVYILITALMSTLLLAGCATNDASENGEVTIKYWQYFFESKEKALTELIAKFETENPGIKVVQETFPYDQFNQKIAAAMKANTGPEVVNLFYGWIPKYVEEGYLQPIPKDLMSNADIEKTFVPMITESKLDDKYYALPTAVRTLAFFWNKDLFKAANLDPEKAPQTWDEVLDYAKTLTKRDSAGTLEQSGYGWNVGGQDYHLFIQVLLRQWGVDPYSENNKKVQWNSSQSGYDAFTWWLDLTKEHKVGEEAFLGTYDKAFLAGKTAMMTDGSFRLGALKDATFQWGVAPLPVKEPGGEESTYGSFWANGITKNVEGKKLDASIKFMKFMTSEDTMRYWLENVGEIPASNVLAEDKVLQADPVFGPFMKGLPNAHATFFVDETGERKIVIDGINEILLNNMDINKALDDIVSKEQKLRDDYYSNK